MKPLLKFVDSMLKIYRDYIIEEMDIVKNQIKHK